MSETTQMQTSRFFSVDFHSFIHSGYFYSASSSPLLFRGTPHYSTDTVLESTHQALQETVSEGLAQGPYVAARVRFEPATHW